MGNQKSMTPDPPRHTVRDLSAVIAGSGASATVPTNAGCSATVTVAFKGYRLFELSGDEQVRMFANDPTGIYMGDLRVGDVAPIHSPYFAGCMRNGYRMTGSLISFDHEKQEGFARLKGELVE